MPPYLDRKNSNRYICHGYMNNPMDIKMQWQDWVLFALIVIDFIVVVIVLLSPI